MKAVQQQMSQIHLGRGLKKPVKRKSKEKEACGISLVRNYLDGRIRREKHLDELGHCSHLRNGLIPRDPGRKWGARRAGMS